MGYYSANGRILRSFSSRRFRSDVLIFWFKSVGFDFILKWFRRFTSEIVYGDHSYSSAWESVDRVVDRSGMRSQRSACIVSWCPLTAHSTLHSLSTSCRLQLPVADPITLRWSAPFPSTAARSTQTILVWSTCIGHLQRQLGFTWRPKDRQASSACGNAATATQRHLQSNHRPRINKTPTTCTWDNLNHVINIYLCDRDTRRPSYSAHFVSLVQAY